MDKQQFDQLAQQTNWEGDYREPIADDFLPSPEHSKHQPLLRKHDGEALRSTIFWGLVIIVASLFNWYQGDRYAFMVSLPAVFADGEYYRLWSSLFIHSDFGHLASNLWLFLVFGFLLRSFWGLAVFPFLTFGFVGGASSLVTILWYRSETYLLGASGMIYGMIALWLVKPTAVTSFVILSRCEYFGRSALSS